ncbi:MAG: CoA-binding protein [Actinomycetota bacterium]
MAALLDHDDDIAALLRRTRTIAVVGMSPRPNRASHGVARYLTERGGYDVWFVNPNETEILGRPVYASLAALPEAPDLVDVFRRTAELPEVAAEAIEVGAAAIWFQLGLVHHDAAAASVAGGLDVVQDRCTKVEHARLL